jgi:hypothetical protein
MIDNEILVPVEVTGAMQFREVETRLREQSGQPLLISLPEDSPAFASAGDYDRLLELPVKIRAFVVPPGRMEFVAEQAARIGVACYTPDEISIEELPTRDNLLDDAYATTAVAPATLFSGQFDHRAGAARDFKIPVRTIIVLTSIVGLLTILVVPFLVADPTTMLRVPTASSLHSTPARAQTGKQIGTGLFFDSGLIDPTTTVFGSMDQFSLSMRTLPTPTTRMEDVVWLLPDVADHATLPLLLGTLQRGQTEIRYASSTHQNLLIHYSRVLITEQPAHTSAMMPPQNTKVWQATGAFPIIPAANDENHFTLLDHLRHLLAADPTLQDNGLPGGLIQWMARNVNKEAEWASAAQGDWSPQMTENDRKLIDRLLIRMLDYLDGSRFVEMDVPTGTPLLISPVDSASIGLINRLPHQEPEGFLQHIQTHLDGVAIAPGHTASQSHIATQINAVIQQMIKDLQMVQKDATALLKMNTRQLRQPAALTLLDNIKLLTASDESGWFDASLHANTGGVVWINAMAEQVAVLPISRN